MDAYGLMKYMRLDHEVCGAQWDDVDSVWKVSVLNLRTNETLVDSAEILVNNCGVLKSVNFLVQDVLLILAVIGNGQRSKD